MRRKHIQARTADEQRQKIKEQKLKTQQILEDKAKKEREIKRQHWLKQCQSKAKASNETQRKHEEECLKTNIDLAQRIDEEKKVNIM